VVWCKGSLNILLILMCMGLWKIFLTHTSSVFVLRKLLFQQMLFPIYSIHFNPQQSVIFQAAIVKPLNGFPILSRTCRSISSGVENCKVHIFQRYYVRLEAGIFSRYSGSLWAVWPKDWIQMVGKIFSTRPDQQPGPPSLLYNGLFPWGKAAPGGGGGGVDHPPPSSGQGKKRGGLCL
jgi:hypothetical protein